MTTAPRFPLEPLAQALGIELHTPDRHPGTRDPDTGYHALADACDVTWRTVARWATHGLPTYAADRAAITALGIHPLIIWPTWLDDLNPPATTDPQPPRHRVAA